MSRIAIVMTLWKPISTTVQPVVSNLAEWFPLTQIAVIDAVKRSQREQARELLNQIKKFKNIL